MQSHLLVPTMSEYYKALRHYEKLDSETNKQTLELVSKNILGCTKYYQTAEEIYSSTPFKGTRHYALSVMLRLAKTEQEIQNILGGVAKTSSLYGKAKDKLAALRGGG